VTGLGVISSIGIGIGPFWKNLLKGTSGISRIKSFCPDDFRTQYAGEVKKFDPSRFMANPEKKGKTSQFLLASAKLALKDSKISSKEYKKIRSGLVVGTTALEPSTLEKINDILIKKGADKVSGDLIAKAAVDTPPDIIAKELGINSFVQAIPTACSAGNYAIGYGFDLIRQNRAKLVFCSGVDIFFRLIHAGFNRLMVVSPDKCRPFDKNRKGTIMGEGAASLILEDLDSAIERGANIYAEVLGYGLSCDAFTLTTPSKDGMKDVMTRAMKNAGVDRNKVDYICAHGTGTINNDKSESAAIRGVFGKRTKDVPVTSIKSMLGHTVGAASAIEAVSCCLSIRDGIIPPTVNFETPASECNINVVANRSLRKKVNIAMNNSFAFGGNNACVIFGKLNRKRS